VGVRTGAADRAGRDGRHRQAAGQEQRHEQSTTGSNETRGELCLRHDHRTRHHLDPPPLSLWARFREGVKDRPGQLAGAATHACPT